MQNLTKDNIKTYLLDILNILCIPYGIGCYDDADTGTVSIINGALKRADYYEFKAIKIFKGLFWGYYTTYYNIDTCNLIHLYEIAKLICTADSTTCHLQQIGCNTATMIVCNNLQHTNNKLTLKTSYTKLCYYIKFGFIYDNTIAGRIDAIKDAMCNAFHGAGFASASASAIPYEPVATEVEKPSPTAPLAEAEVVA